MKGLTLTQPWATLIAAGAKRIETRSWSTDYRGPLAIHAAKGLGPVGGKSGFTDQCATPAFSNALGEWFERFGAMRSAERAGWVMPLGAIVATAQLVAVKRIDQRLRAEVLAQAVTPNEIEFGDYTSGRFAWYLENVKYLEHPIECKGALGLWDIPREISMQIAGITETDIAETRTPELWPA